MSRLSSERQRLYALSPDQTLTASGGTRALCLTLSRPADWATLSRLWEGVQDAWQWPAPAVAVSGSDGLQLWFSLQAPVDDASAQAILQTLRRHFLADVTPERIQLHTSDQALPPQQNANGCWSAFVAPGLASVFADEPWLDRPPSDDAQADILARLSSLSSQDLARLPATTGSLDQSPAEAATRAFTPTTASQMPAAMAATSDTDPRQFLLRVMNDGSVPLALRIEAAKALLPHA